MFHVSGGGGRGEGGSLLIDNGEAFRLVEGNDWCFYLDRPIVDRGSWEGLFLCILRLYVFTRALDQRAH